MSSKVGQTRAIPELLPAVPITSGTRRNLVVAGIATLVLSGGYATWRLSSDRYAHAATEVTSNPYQDNPEATALFRKARFELATRTAEGLTLAQQDFRHLTERYPRSAAGWSGLADSYLLLREFGAVPEAQAYPEAARAARAAIALDPNSADAWLDVGFVAFWWEGDTIAGLHAFETALKLDSGSAKAFHWYATALLGIGDFGKSLTMIVRARELDPGNRAIVADDAWIHFCAGRRAEGLAALESLVLVEPKFASPHLYLSRAYLIMSRDEDFLREAVAAAQLRGQTDVVANLRLAEASFLAGGRRAMLDQLSTSATEAWRQGAGSAIAVAAYRALANDRAGMMKWLDIAEAAKDYNLIFLVADPYFANYRSDRGFEAIVGRLH